MTRGTLPAKRGTGLRLWLVVYLLVRSLIVIVLGLLLLLRPTDTVHALARFVGVVLLVLAVIDYAAAVWPGPGRGTRGLLVLRGIVTGGVGALLLLLTDVTVTAVAILVGMQMVVSGGVSVLVSLQLRERVGAWAGVTARGAVALAAGIAALIWPRVTIVVVAVIVGVQWVIGGLVSAGTAVKVAEERRAARVESRGSSPE